jgi:hypothetical protein
MLVKLYVPPSEEYPSGKEVWVHAEDIDRVEGHSDWKMKKTTVYLKRNPTEPFLVIEKAIVNVVDPINQEMDSLSNQIANLAQHVQDLVALLGNQRGE